MTLDHSPTHPQASISHLPKKRAGPPPSMPRSLPSPSGRVVERGLGTPNEINTNSQTAAQSGGTATAAVTARARAWKVGRAPAFPTPGQGVPASRLPAALGLAGLVPGFLSAFPEWDAGGWDPANLLPGKRSQEAASLGTRVPPPRQLATRRPTHPEEAERPNGRAHDTHGDIPNP
jgi:hypothetical protein